MAALLCNLKQVLLITFLFHILASFSILSSSSQPPLPHTNDHHLFGRRILLDDEHQLQPIKNKISSKNLKPTKLVPPSDLVSKVKKNKTNEEKPATKSHLKKTNSSTLKSPKSPKNSTFPTKKSSYLSKTPPKNQEFIKGGAAIKKLPTWVDSSHIDDDLESGFINLPSKFQQTLLPDLEKLSKTSKIYLKEANKDLTRNFKPFIGKNYAATIASLVTLTFILLPFILVSLIINKIKAYFSLQKTLIFIQAYLSIYFITLSLLSLISGLEPFRFLYATSQYNTYVCLQILQTVAYMLYLMLLLMYLILVFSTETGVPTKLLGLGQTFVGVAVGLHYYMMVFHRAVLNEPPKTSWRIHGIYGLCFFVLSMFTGAHRRKKDYSDCDDVGKIS